MSGVLQKCYALVVERDGVAGGSPMVMETPLGATAYELRRRARALPVEKFGRAWVVELPVELAVVVVPRLNLDDAENPVGEVER